MRNYGTGPIIVSVRGAQIALGRGEAGRIKVHLTELEGK
jgi:Fe2+ transport system protein FeoA